MSIDTKHGEGTRFYRVKPVYGPYAGVWPSNKDDAFVQGLWRMLDGDEPVEHRWQPVKFESLPKKVPLADFFKPFGTVPLNVLGINMKTIPEHLRQLCLASGELLPAVVDNNDVFLFRITRRLRCVDEERSTFWFMQGERYAKILFVDRAKIAKSGFCRVDESEVDCAYVETSEPDSFSSLYERNGWTGLRFVEIPFSDQIGEKVYTELRVDSIFPALPADDDVCRQGAGD